MEQQPTGGPLPSRRRAILAPLLAAAAVLLVIATASWLAGSAGDQAPPAVAAATAPAWTAVAEVREGGRWWFVGRGEAADEATAVRQADDAAIDLAMWRLAREIAVPHFERNVAPWFHDKSDEARRMIELAGAAADPIDRERWQGYQVTSRRRTAEAARRSGGLPPTRAELHLEPALGGARIAFSRLAIPEPDFRAFAERCVATVPIPGGEVAGPFPLLGWRLDQVRGAVLVAVTDGGALAEAGLHEGDLIEEIGEQPVEDAGSCRALFAAAAVRGGEVAVRGRRLGAVLATVQARVRLPAAAR